MKTFKTKISEKPFKLYGFTLEEFLRWCEKHNLRAYATASKRLFFRKVNEYSIVKINGKVFEDKEEL